MSKSSKKARGSWISNLFSTSADEEGVDSPQSAREGSTSEDGDGGSESGGSRSALSKTRTGEEFDVSAESQGEVNEARGENRGRSRKRSFASDRTSGSASDSRPHSRTASSSTFSQVSMSVSSIGNSFTDLLRRGSTDIDLCGLNQKPVLTTGLLNVIVHEGVSLGGSKKVSATTNSFCRLRCCGQEGLTRQEKTSSPIWEQRFEFFTTADATSLEFCLDAFSSGTLKNTLLGSCSISLEDIVLPCAFERIAMWMDLVKASGSVGGRVKVSMVFRPLCDKLQLKVAGQVGSVQQECQDGAGSALVSGESCVSGVGEGDGEGEGGGQRSGKEGEERSRDEKGAVHGEEKGMNGASEEQCGEQGQGSGSKQLDISVDVIEGLSSSAHNPKDRFGLLVDERVGWMHTCLSDREFIRRCSMPWDRWPAGDDILPCMAFCMKTVRRMGFPQVHRGEAWCVFSRSRELQWHCPGYYQDLLALEDEVIDEDTVAQIEKDLHRTFPGHTLFLHPNGTRSLRNVLIAFSRSNSFVGYCQSMNFISAFLLLFVLEEDAFWLLTKLINDIIPHYFSPQLLGVRADQEVLRALVEMRFPALYSHLSELGFMLHFITIQWFMCLFIGILPSEVTVRVFDCLFVEGPEILFGVALYVLGERKAELYQCESYCEAFAIFRGIGAGMCDGDAVVKGAYEELKNLEKQDIDLLAIRQQMLTRLEEDAKNNELHQLLQSSKFTKKELERIHSHFNIGIVCSGEIPIKTSKDEGVKSLTRETFAEVINMLYTNPGIDIIDKMFNIFDKDNSGEIDFHEFLCGMCVLCKGTPEEKLEMAFRVFDLDDSGYLDLDELRLLLSIQQQMYTSSAAHTASVRFSAENMMLLYDKNGDHKLSFSEFLEALQEPPYSLLSGWLQVMATSRLGPESPEGRASLEIGKLSALSKSINMADYE